ncbi:MAG: redox-sensing transcriptional repressor Rex [Halanaerobiaceae bacterium]|nr:redox-sensing transcriptional repressor Rex [Halanaerobiaceae bacterium]
MKGRNYIPKATIERLPLYYRCLDRLSSYEDIDVISSKELGGKLGIPSTQVRKDLSYYGEFGRRGVGYDVDGLKRSIARILGINKLWSAALVGAGNLGTALVNYGRSSSMALKITNVFHADPGKIGNKLGDIIVQSMKEIKETVKNDNINIGIVTVPASEAQKVTEELVEAGIRSIWNFSPIRLIVPEEVMVRNEDLSVGIAS